jgi:hypothetical protein
MSAADDLCTGAQSEKTSNELSRVMQYADNIVKYWKKSADISAVASLCAGANKELSPAEKKEFYLKLPFDRTVFSKLARIGSDLRLHHEEIQKLLPANYSMQYEITKLTDDEMKAAIDQRIIHSGAKRAHLLNWKKSRRATKIEAKTEAQQRGSQWQVALRNTTEIKPEDDPFMRKLKRAWDKAVDLKAAWTTVTVDARERFVMEVLKIEVRRSV